MISTERRTELLKKDKSELLREIVYHYAMTYAESDAEARRSIGRDLRNFMDIENPMERWNRKAKKEKAKKEAA